MWGLWKFHCFGFTCRPVVLDFLPNTCLEVYEPTDHMLTVWECFYRHLSNVTGGCKMFEPLRDQASKKWCQSGTWIAAAVWMCWSSPPRPKLTKKSRRKVGNRSGETFGNLNPWKIGKHFMIYKWFVVLSIIWSLYRGRMMKRIIGGLFLVILILLIGMLPSWKSGQPGLASSCRTSSCWLVRYSIDLYTVYIRTWSLFYVSLKSKAYATKSRFYLQVLNF